MTDEVVHLQRLADDGVDAGIRILTLDRPERLNAMSGSTSCAPMRPPAWSC
jgi:enoyl-CoA hydratase/carnithine racemase